MSASPCCPHVALKVSAAAMKTGCVGLGNLLVSQVAGILCEFLNCTVLGSIHGAEEGRMADNSLITSLC